MEMSVSDARRHFKEVLDQVGRGRTVHVTRRGRVVAVIASPSAAPTAAPFAEVLDAWRDEWDVASWPEDGPFDGVRDRSEGRAASW